MSNGKDGERLIDDGLLYVQGSRHIGLARRQGNQEKMTHGINNA